MRGSRCLFYCQGGGVALQPMTLTARVSALPCANSFIRPQRFDRPTEVTRRPRKVQHQVQHPRFSLSFHRPQPLRRPRRRRQPRHECVEHPQLATARWLCAHSATGCAVSRRWSRAGTSKVVIATLIAASASGASTSPRCCAFLRMTWMRHLRDGVGFFMVDSLAIAAASCQVGARQRSGSRMGTSDGGSRPVARALGPS